MLRRGKDFHREVQRFYSADYEGEDISSEKSVNRSVDWRKAKENPSGIPPAFLRGNSVGRRGRFDILILIETPDPDFPILEGQPSISSYSLLEIKSTHFDGRSTENVRRLISRHRKQMVDYLGTLVDFGTPGTAAYPEGTIAPGIIYPSAPRDAEVRRFVEDFFDEDCIAVVWFDELSKK